MKTEIIINGQDGSINLRRGDQGGNRKAMVAMVEGLGLEWKAADIFVANFPEAGRFLIKKPGYDQLSAGG